MFTVIHSDHIATTQAFFFIGARSNIRCVSSCHVLRSLSKLAKVRSKATKAFSTQNKMIMPSISDKTAATVASTQMFGGFFNSRK